MRPPVKREARRLALFDALVAAPEGLDFVQIADQLGLDAGKNSHRSTVYGVIRDLRLRLGVANADDDTTVHGYTLPVTRQGDGRYVYKLAARHEDGAEWHGMRVDTLTSRLDVDIAYWQSLTAITDGRSRDGKVARACVRRFAQLVDDIAEIQELVE